MQKKTKLVAPIMLLVLGVSISGCIVTDNDIGQWKTIGNIDCCIISVEKTQWGNLNIITVEIKNNGNAPVSIGAGDFNLRDFYDSRPYTTWGDLITIGPGETAKYSLNFGKVVSIPPIAFIRYLEFNNAGQSVKYQIRGLID